MKSVLKAYYPIYKAFIIFALSLLLLSNSAIAQIDTEFWFVVPELSHRNSTGGTPGTLRIATMELAATVTIEMPANPSFTVITVDIPANSDAAVDLTNFIDLPAFANRNLLENKPVVASGVNNFGLHITATSLISAYWEVNFTGGADLWVLKGKNGLGTLFYTPFQQEANNLNVSYGVTITPKPYSAIDVVATKPNTQVTFSLPPGKSASYGQGNSFAHPATYTVTLNRGQTFSLFPLNYDFTIAGRLAGTKIEATDSIAVCVKDDAVNASGESDVIGDQLVPINVIGSKYIVPPYNGTNRVYVIATEPNTTVRVTNALGVFQSEVTLALVGQQGWVNIPNANTYYLVASTNSAKFYAFHVAPDNKGRGGAILPAVGQCTGNTQVAFTRARNDNRFYMFILVEDGNQDKFLLDGLPAPSQIIDPTKFVPVAGTDGWLAYKSGVINVATLPIGQHRVTNTGGVFHFGILNGFPSGQMYYGYYSDYGNLNFGAFAGGDQAASQVIRACYGSDVNLYAFGGTTYSWSQPAPYTFLNDTTIQNPIASGLESGAHSFSVYIGGDCAGGNVLIDVLVSDEVAALFQTSTTSGCNPLTDILFTDRSVNAYSWQYDMGDGTPLIKYDINPSTPTIPDPPVPFAFTHTYTNYTDEPVDYVVTLLVKNTDGCADIYTKTITVYPSISSSFVAIPTDGLCVNPLEVTFTNTSFSNSNPAACADYPSYPGYQDWFIWEFGDGFNHISNDCNETFTHTYSNTDPLAAEYEARLIAFSPFGCRDTSIATITVTSFVYPEFYVDIPSGCHDPDAGGHVVQISSNLLLPQAGDIFWHQWSISPAVPGLTFPVDGSDFTITLPNTTNNIRTYTITLSARNIDNCLKEVTKDIIVYPSVSTSFTVSDNEICSGETITFTNNTTPLPLAPGNQYTFSWDFGDGAGSILQNTSHTYNNVNDTPQSYDVILYSTNPWGCTDSDTVEVTVWSRISADFVVFPAEGCSPLTLEITDNSFGNLVNTYTWDFDGGTVDPFDPWIYTYEANGLVPEPYQISLTVTNEGNCSASKTVDVTVYPPVVITDIVPITGTTTICDSVSVDFSVTINPNLPNMNHSWSFGDGAWGLGAAPSHIYRNFGANSDTYDVTLVSTNKWGCMDVENTNVEVQPYIKALFSVDKYEICSGEDITFTYHKMTSIQDYTFDFAGYPDNSWPGDLASNGTFIKNFDNSTGSPLTVTVTLTVTNGDITCDKVYSIDIIVYPDIVPSFSIVSDDKICGGNSIEFNNGSVGGTLYLWDFGDGTQQYIPIGQPVIHFYQNKTQNPITYQVTLTATNVIGCFGAPISIDVTIYPEVSAAQSIEIIDRCNGTQIQLTNSSLNGTSFTWTFTPDDLVHGASQSQIINDPNEKPTLTLTNTDQVNPVTYTVGFTAISAWAGGPTCSATIAGSDVIVYPILTPVFVAPEAECSGLTGVEITFAKDGSSSGGPENGVSLIWTFGDGNSESTQFTGTTHTFINLGPGDFITATQVQATQIATGCTASTTIPVTIHPKVEALYTFEITNQCEPLDLVLTNSSLNGSEFEWTFTPGGAGGNTETVTTNNNTDTPTVSLQNNLYDNSLMYIVEFTATTVHATRTCSNSAPLQGITVYPRLNLSYIAPDPVCSGLTGATVEFVKNVDYSGADYSTGGPSTLTWNFGDGNTESTQFTNTTHTFINLGPNDFTTATVVQATQIATGCTASTTIPVTIHPKVEANYTFEITDLCEPLDLILTNSSLNGSEFQWTFNPGGAGGNTETISTLNHTDTPTVSLQNNLYDDNLVYTIGFTATTIHATTTCSDPAPDQTITVYPRLNLSYIAPDPVCSGLTGETVEFVKNVDYSGADYSTGGPSTLIWDFGDGNTQTTSFTNTSHTFVNLGPNSFITPTVVTATQNATGCNASTTIPVTIYPKVESNFTFQYEDVCTPYEVNFTNSSVNGNSFTWDYGYTIGGVPQVEVLPNNNPHSHTFYNETANDIQTYTITLTVDDTNTGCNHTFSRDIQVYPNVVAAFISDEPSNCSDIAFTFTNNSTGGDMIFEWDFGDGQTATTTTEPTISHSYVNWDGNNQPFNVTLRATNVNGCTNITSQVVNVHPKVVADFTMYSISLCTPYDVQFTNSSINGTEFHWDYGYTLDNVYQEQTTYAGTTIHNHTFHNETLEDIFYYNIILTSLDANTGCFDEFSRPIEVYPNVVAGFETDYPALCSDVDFTFTNLSTGGEYLTFEWNFDDGRTLVTYNRDPVVHAFTHREPTETSFNVTIKAINPLGCYDIFSQIVTVYPKVEANFTFGHDSVCTPFDVIFTNESLNGNEFTWDFGHLGLTNVTTDNSSFWQTFDNLELDEIQIYTITLVANDVNTGCNDVTTKPITVYPRVVANITPTELTACSDHEVVFTNQSTGGANAPGAGLVFTWLFQDGQSATSNGLASQSHVFVNRELADITRNVIVTATNPNGCFHSQVIPITTHPKVEANFTMVYNDQCTPFDVQFTNASLNGTEFRWDFGHVNTTGNQTATNPGSVFTWEFDNFEDNDELTYTVQLIAETVHTLTSGLTCGDTLEKAINVAPQLWPSFTITDTVGCSDRVVQFTNTSTGGYTLEWDWDFSDGESSSVQDPNHTFIYLGDPDDPIGYQRHKTYPINLTVTNPRGCVRDITEDVIVFPRVQANFTFDTTGVCTPIVANFVNTSLNGSVFVWDYGYDFEGVAQGETTNRPTLTHSYAFRNTTESVENYPINLWAYTDHTWLTDVYRCENNATPKTVTIYPELNLNYVPDPPAVCSDQTITFVKGPSTGGVANLIWDFKDGNTEASNYQNVPHFYTNINATDFVQNVRVTATQPNGCAKYQDIPVRVHPRVVSNFAFTIGDVCEYPLPVTFTNSSVFATPNAGINTTFLWDYGYTWQSVYQQETFTSSSPHLYSFYNAQANAISPYDITLTTSQLHSVSGLTCSDDSVRSINVYPELIAIIDITPDEGCNPLTVNYINGSSGVLTGSHLWNLGDETWSTQSIPAEKIYSHPNKTASEFYDVLLTITNPLGCTKQAGHTIEVYPLVIADFYVNVNEGCTPLNVTFQNLSTSPVYQYLWNFVYNNQTSTLAQPGTRRFVNVPTTPLSIYQPVITLTTGLSGYPETCQEIANKPISVFPHIYPNFEGDFEGCHPHAVQFTNNTNAFGGVNNATYYWTLGNQVNSWAVNPSQTYLNTSFTHDATFPVKVYATSVHGCIDSVQHNVVVHPKPKARMEMLSQYVACPPLEAIFDNQSLGTNLTFDFDFGDGTDSTTTSTANMVHHFGNDDTNEAKPYVITLTTTTAFGCTDFTTQTIYVFPEVHVDFTFDPDAACNPHTPVISNLSTTSAFYYYWDFDDGYTSNLFEPQHRFVNTSIQDRVFDVELRAVSTYDCEDLITKPLLVYAAPIADFKINPPLKVYPDATFEFLNQSNPANPAWTYLWNYGDNTGSDEQHSGTHSKTYDWWNIYDDYFRYFVTLIINNKNCIDTVTHFLTLLPAEPIVLFESENYKSCSPLKVYFINNSLYGDSCLWDFGDGTTSTQWEPYHEFYDPGYFNVSLTVYGSGGVKHYYDIYRVYENPKAKFEVLPERVMLPNPQVRLFNLSERATRSVWDLGDGTISDAWEPVHTYPNEIAQYGITLTVYAQYDDGVECVDDTSSVPAVWVEGAGRIRFPNAFVPSLLGPNGGEYDAVDFKNEVFHPYSDGVIEYKLLIFNRWGEQIFRSDDIRIGWDGYYKGKLCDQGVYVWRATGKFTNGQQFDLRGNVTLLR
jgi:PKD repeat protein